MEASDRERRYRAEFLMMSSRLGGVVQQAVAAAVLDSHDKEGGRAPSREVRAAEVPQGGAPPAPPPPAAVLPRGDTSSTSTPCGMASAFLRGLEAQLQAKKYMSAGDEAGDVLGGFSSATLMYYPGGGLQGVVEDVAAAAGEVRCGAAPAAVALLRSLAGAVGRLASQPSAEAAGDKAAAVATCLFGMAEALEGATKSSGSVPAAPVVVDPAAVTAAAEAGQLLREVAGLVDCISASSIYASHTSEAGHTVSPSAPAHPLLSALETRMYSEATWRSNSAAEIAAGLVDYVAALLAPGRAGDTTTSASAAARGAACGALHSLARAQMALAATLRDHGAEPAAASRLLAALAEALAAACITRDAADSMRGPRPLTMFGEAQLMVGLSRMAAGEALAVAQAPGGVAAAADTAAAAVAADAAAGDASSDCNIAVSDSSLVLEVLAAQAQEVAANHCDHIAQVLQDLRDVPRSLGTLSELPGELAVTAPAAARFARGGAAEGLLRRAGAGRGDAASAAAAYSVAEDIQAAFGGPRGGRGAAAGAAAGDAGARNLDAGKGAAGSA